MKLGRNQPCHCGSGTKYKICCLKTKNEAKREAIRNPPPRKKLSHKDQMELTQALGTLMVLSL